ncbi:MAG TPA: Nramp family divalent metal transporter [Candidatus Baltobacteraceae bacterium]|nr:Nramp family divalent metal transporter [Candidatus Baltobacteraceae bacterium]
MREATPSPPPRRRTLSRRIRLAATLAVLGPGIVSGFADNDAGGITTYSLAGVRFGYDLLWVILLTQIVLFFTQEMGARLGLATGQGLTGLIRSRFGVRWAAFASATMLVANLGTTVAEFAGIGAALSIFGVPVPISALVASVAVVWLIAQGSFARVQYAFVAVGIGVSIAYVASAVLAHPDWGRAANALVIPHLESSGAYWLAVLGTVGTTITPWGQQFIQAYVVNKQLDEHDLTPERLDVTIGVFLTNFVAAFIVIACAAALWSHGITNVTNPTQIAQALGPLAGDGARVLFGVGLLAASLLGLGVVPLTSAYTACEAFGWESGVEWRWREAPAFYGLLAFFVGFAALFLLIPGLPLLQVMFLAQVVNGLLLPIILVFLMLLAGDRNLAGPLANGPFLSVVGWAITAMLAVLSVVFVATQFLPG